MLEERKYMYKKRLNSETDEGGAETFEFYPNSDRALII